jgi:hypothetical protein
MINKNRVRTTKMAGQTIYSYWNAALWAFLAGLSSHWAAP